MKRKQWNDTDARAFADGARTRAHTFTDRRKKKAKEACRKWNWKNI